MRARTNDTLPPPVFRDYENDEINTDIDPEEEPAQAVQNFLKQERATINQLATYRPGPLHCDHLSVIAPDGVQVILQEDLAQAIINVAKAQNVKAPAFTHVLHAQTNLRNDPLFVQLRTVADLTGAPPTLDTLCTLTLSDKKTARYFSAAFHHPHALKPIVFSEQALIKLATDPRLVDKTDSFQAGLALIKNGNGLLRKSPNSVMKNASTLLCAFLVLAHMYSQDIDLKAQFNDLAKDPSTGLYVSRRHQLVTDAPLPQSTSDITTVYNLKTKNIDTITRNTLFSPWRLWEGSYHITPVQVPETEATQRFLKTEQAWKNAQKNNHSTANTPRPKVVLPS